MHDNIEIINTPQELASWADKHGLRPDWHEPDEQNIDAVVIGGHLDNAFGAEGHDRFPEAARNLIRGLDDELRVVLIVDADTPDRAPAAIVNLASLLAWASAPFRQ